MGHATKPRKRVRIDASTEANRILVNAELSAALDTFLSSVSGRAKDRGRKLPKKVVLRALVRVLQDLDQAGRLRVEGSMSEEEFVSRLREAVGIK